MATSLAEVQAIIDGALEGEADTPRRSSVPDRETWGSTPEDIQAQLAMQDMVAKRKPKASS